MKLGSRSPGRITFPEAPTLSIGSITALLLPAVDDKDKKKSERLLTALTQQKGLGVLEPRRARCPVRAHRPLTPCGPGQRPHGAGDSRPHCMSAMWTSVVPEPVCARLTPTRSRAELRKKFQVESVGGWAVEPLDKLW